MVDELCDELNDTIMNSNKIRTILNDVANTSSSSEYPYASPRNGNKHNGKKKANNTSNSPDLNGGLSPTRPHKQTSLGLAPNPPRCSQRNKGNGRGIRQIPKQHHHNSNGDNSSTTNINYIKTVDSPQSNYTVKARANKNGGYYQAGDVANTSSSF